MTEFACFVPVGFAATTLVALGSGRRRRCAVNLAGLAVGMALTALPCVTRIASSWYLATAVGLTFPLLGCLVGAWAGVRWRRGWRARLWFGPDVALLALVLALAPGMAVWSSLEETPFSFEAVPARSAAEQPLTRLVRRGSPKSPSHEQTRTLQLAERDANAFLSWGFSSETRQRKAMVHLRRDVISFLLSWPVRLGEGKLRYLNLEVTGTAAVAEGTLGLRVDHCRIGSGELPHCLLAGLSSLVTSWLNHDRQVQPYLRATQEMAIEPNLIRLTYRPVDLAIRFRHKLPRLYTPSAELQAATRAQADHLLLLFAAHSLPDESPSFDLYVRTAFALARRRAAQHDAVTENRAALLALGILLGHPGIEDVIGPVLSDRNREEAQQILTRVVLHERSDWTRHFCVSAALAVLSDQAVSDACGVLKEELDTDADGSGFSFADLLVDRAGTMFAVRATRDEAAARTMQDCFRPGFRLEEICPRADGLPEGVSETELQSRYGGRDGEGYRRLLEEIERRIAACAAYR